MESRCFRSLSPAGNRGLQKNIGKQNNEAISASVLGETLLKFMDGKDIWEGTATQLLDELEMIAQELKIDTRHRKWPKAPNALTRRINEIKTNFTELGLHFNINKSGNRSIKLEWKFSRDSISESTTRVCPRCQSTKVDSPDKENWFCGDCSVFFDIDKIPS